jgi:indolepyruvate ferredoxin oxidoreductase beta subunit
MKNILITGVGGQGAVLASKILAQCALQRGEAAHTAETIGMAQRGGSVTSHVRLGDGVFSPLIPKGTADIVLGFEPAEAARCLPYLSPKGAIIVSNRALQPSAAGGYDSVAMLNFLHQTCQGMFLVVDAVAVFEACGSYKPLNIALLGAASIAGVLGFTPDELETAMRKLMPARNIESSLPALQLGAANMKEEEVSL